VDENRWLIEHLLITNRIDGAGPLWTSTSVLMSLDGARGTYSLDEAVRQIGNMKDHFLFRGRHMRLRNIDTEEIIPADFL